MAVPLLTVWAFVACYRENFTFLPVFVVTLQWQLLGGVGAEERPDGRLLRTGFVGNLVRMVSSVCGE